jgi:hypothetical protein
VLRTGITALVAMAFAAWLVWLIFSAFKNPTFYCGGRYYKRSGHPFRFWTTIAVLSGFLSVIVYFGVQALKRLVE